MLSGGAFVAPEQIWIEGSELLATVPRSNRVVGFALTDGGAPGSPEADVPPSRNLEGPLTGFTGVVGAQPRGITVANGELYVSVPPFRVSVFDLATANGNQAPTRTLEGPFMGPTGIANSAGLWVHSGELYVASEENASVRVFDALASGPASPLRVFAGASTGLSFPKGVLVTSQ